MTKAPLYRILFSLTLALFCIALCAQNSIQGKVYDSEGHPLAFTTVSIVNSNEGTFTDETGYFQLKNIPDGESKIELRQLGFRSQTLLIKLPEKKQQHTYFLPGKRCFTPR